MKTMLKLAAALAAAGTLGNAHALILSPGTSPIAGPTASASSDFGTLLQFVSTDLATPTFAGEARVAVYDGPEAGVNLDFYYQFTSDGGSADSIARLTAGGFDGMSVDVYQNSGGWGSFVQGTAPSSTVDMTTGGTLGFNFGPPGVTSGLTTSVFQVRTTATSYVDAWMGVINGTASLVRAFAPGPGALPEPPAPPVIPEPPVVIPEPPVAEIPEPETYALMLAGLGMLGFVGRRRCARSA